jgi:hypothetical protein
MPMAAYLPLVWRAAQRHAGVMRAGGVARSVWARLRAVHAESLEASERLWLLQNPWQEELLHWGADGRLHGHRIPGSTRTHSTTSSGWCPGLRFASSSHR